MFLIVFFFNTTQAHIEPVYSIVTFLFPYVVMVWYVIPCFVVKIYEQKRIYRLQTFLEIIEFMCWTVADWFQNFHWVNQIKVGKSNKLYKNIDILGHLTKDSSPFINEISPLKFLGYYFLRSFCHSFEFFISFLVSRHCCTTIIKINFLSRLLYF